MFDSLHNRLKNENLSFSERDIAKIIFEESSYDKYKKGEGKQFVGPIQANAERFASLYSKEKDGISGQEVWDEYANGTRKDEDIVEDIIRYFRWMDGRIKSNRDLMTYGRIKVNQYAPNRSLDDIVSDDVWNNNIKYEIDLGRLDSNLSKGKTTYRDLVYSYDRNNK